VQGLEILELNTSRSDWVFARVALNGKLAIPFEVPKSTFVEDFRRSEDFEAFLARQAQSLIDAYGDARDCRPEPAQEFCA
jgi:hypothetical protein